MMVRMMMAMMVVMLMMRVVMVMMVMMMTTTMMTMMTTTTTTMMMVMMVANRPKHKFVCVGCDDGAVGMYQVKLCSKASIVKYMKSDKYGKGWNQSNAKPRLRPFSPRFMACTKVLTLS